MHVLFSFRYDVSFTSEKILLARLNRPTITFETEFYFLSVAKDFFLLQNVLSNKSYINLPLTFYVKWQIDKTYSDYEYNIF